MTPDQIAYLLTLLQSHCDTPVSRLLSGSDPVWTCQARIEDLREDIDQLKIQEEANYDLSRQVHELEAEVTILSSGVMPVSPEEQVEIVRKLIRDHEI